MSWFSLPVLAFLVAAILHARLVRARVDANRVIVFLLTATAVGAGLLALLCSRYGLGVELAAAVLLYAFLCELYIFAFSSVIGSVSAAILMRLLSTRELAAIDTCDGTEMTRRRLANLEASGFIQRNVDSFRVTPKGQILVTTYSACRAFFAHDRS